MLDADKKKKVERKDLEREFSRADKSKQYNLCQAAKILDVHRQTLYYWMKKGWIKSKRDYRNYPIFTVLDIKTIKKWRKTGVKSFPLL